MGISIDSSEGDRPTVRGTRYKSTTNRQFSCIGAALEVLDESEALHRIGRILQQHQDTVSALASFARARDNHIFLIPGNHDAALLFPAVRNAVAVALATPGRVTVETPGYWRSPDDLIYVEHGHQIGKEVNRFAGWPAPFIESGGRRYLRRPWGEKFVQDIYNQYEEYYPIIDNISVESAGVRYALRAQPIAETSRAIGSFMNLLWFDISRKQKADVLGGAGSRTVCDWHSVKRKGDQELVDSIPEPALRQAAGKALAENKLALRISAYRRMISSRFATPER